MSIVPTCAQITRAATSSMFDLTPNIDSTPGQAFTFTPRESLVDLTPTWETITERTVGPEREMVSVGAEDGEVVASIDHIGEDSERGISAYLTPTEARAVAAALIKLADTIEGKPAKVADEQPVEHVLTAAQLDGTACHRCGRDFDGSGVAAAADGFGPHGQLFACAGDNDSYPLTPTTEHLAAPGRQAKQ
ncbi:hypothetical protein [Nocardia sp. NPDC004415]